MTATKHFAVTNGYRVTQVTGDDITTVAITGTSRRRGVPRSAWSSLASSASTGKTVHAPAGSPSVPARFGRYVTKVSGLDTGEQMRPGLDQPSAPGCRAAPGVRQRATPCSSYFGPARWRRTCPGVRRHAAVRAVRLHAQQVPQGLRDRAHRQAPASTAPARRWRSSTPTTRRRSRDDANTVLAAARPAEREHHARRLAGGQQRARDAGHARRPAGLVGRGDARRRGRPRDGPGRRRSSTRAPTRRSTSTCRRPSNDVVDNHQAQIVTNSYGERRRLRQLRRLATRSSCRPRPTGIGDLLLLRRRGRRDPGPERPRRPRGRLAGQQPVRHGRRRHEPRASRRATATGSRPAGAPARAR